MAEVAKSVVSEPDKCEPEEVSLQELIDTELALRVPLKNQSSFSNDFLTAEREHSSLCPPTLSVLALNQHNLSCHNGNQQEEWTTVEEVAKDIQGGDGVENGDNTNNNDIYDNIEIENGKLEIPEIFIQENEVVETSEKKKKKKISGEGDTITTKVKKTKKTKKTEEKENHISVKSSFSKFDQLSKKVLHVRSSDSAKASKTFTQSTSDGQNPVCKLCSKTVFAMEQVKAERAVWHKNCFRCDTCNKQLTVDIYSSHEGNLYCKPHFKELFKPKVVLDQEEEPVRRRKPEMIIRENQPMELPPDVVRASDKPDLGLDELSSLNVKSRFQVFEKQDTVDGELERSPTTVSVKRSNSIMSKLAKFQKKGMDIGVTDEALNGFVYEESSSSEEDDEDEDDEEDKGIIKCRRKAKERPISFGKIDDVKKNWESQQDQHTRREKAREQKKEELQTLRSRLFMGKQKNMKELYEQAVAESEGKPVKSTDDIVRSEKARTVREKFEKGETANSDDEETKGKKVEEDMSVFEEGISKKSRSLFLEMDANAAKTQNNAPTSPNKEPPKVNKKAREIFYSRQPSEDVVRSSDVVEDVVVETADLSSKFKFFETYKPTEKEKKKFRFTPPREGQLKSQSPDREVYRDPDVVRCDEKNEEEQIVMRSQTASRMLSMFRQMEEQKEVLPDGPKPPKCFTPPPDYKENGTSEESEEETDEEDEDEETESDDGVVKSSYKVKDEFLEQAKSAAKAKKLAAKFEAWEDEKQSNNNAITMLDSEQASLDSTKSLRAKFESLKSDQPKEKSRPKVNRFV